MQTFEQLDLNTISQDKHTERLGKQALEAIRDYEFTNRAGRGCSARKLNHQVPTLSQEGS